MADPWKSVERDGMPPCDGHTTIIGINSAGYACCFNAIHGGLCVMETAEGAYRQMSDLRGWRLLDRPAAGVDSSRGPLYKAGPDQSANITPEAGVSTYPGVPASPNDQGEKA